MKKVLLTMVVVGFAAAVAQAQSFSAEHIARVQSEKAMRKIEQKTAAKKELETNTAKSLQKVQKAHNALIASGRANNTVENVFQNMFLQFEELDGAVKELMTLNQEQGRAAKAMLYHDYYVAVRNKNYALCEIVHEAYQLFPALANTVEKTELCD